MNLTTKFDLDQTVWAIGSEEFRRIVKCEVCDCTGKLLIKGAEYVCPKCAGRATRPQWESRKWYVCTHAAQVGQVQVKRTVPHSYNSDDDNANQYMLDSTGIGSGQVWKEERLFASREEAQAECDLRNGALPTDDASHLTLAEAQ